MVKSVSVLPIGSQVTIGYENSPIDAFVSAIGIYPHQILYQCVWWDGRTRKSEWLQEQEVKLNEHGSQHRTSIGFIH